MTISLSCPLCQQFKTNHIIFFIISQESIYVLAYICMPSSIGIIWGCREKFPSRWTFFYYLNSEHLRSVNSCLVLWSCIFSNRYGSLMTNSSLECRSHLILPVIQQPMKYNLHMCHIYVTFSERSIFALSTQCPRIRVIVEHLLETQLNINAMGIWEKRIEFHYTFFLIRTV